MEVDGKVVERWFKHVGKRYDKIMFSIEDVEAFLDDPEKARSYLRHMRACVKPKRIYAADN